MTHIKHCKLTKLSATSKKNLGFYNMCETWGRVRMSIGFIFLMPKGCRSTTLKNYPPRSTWAHDCNNTESCVDKLVSISKSYQYLHIKGWWPYATLFAFNFLNLKKYRNIWRKKRVVYLFVSHEDNGNVGAEVLDLRRPLLGDILQRVGRVDGETHQDHVRVGVGQRSQPNTLKGYCVTRWKFFFQF